MQTTDTSGFKPGLASLFFCTEQVEAVVWDDAIAQHAATWATYLADNNLFQHATNLEALGEGENLYRSGKPIPTEPCTEATKLFYDEVKDYDYNSPGFASNTGHFTQVRFSWNNVNPRLSAGALISNIIHDNTGAPNRPFR